MWQLIVKHNWRRHSQLTFIFKTISVLKSYFFKYLCYYNSRIWQKYWTPLTDSSVTHACRNLYKIINSLSRYLSLKCSTLPESCRHAASDSQRCFATVSRSIAVRPKARIHGQGVLLSPDSPRVSNKEGSQFSGWNCTGNQSWTTIAEELQNHLRHNVIPAQPSHIHRMRSL